MKRKIMEVVAIEDSSADRGVKMKAHELVSKDWWNCLVIENIPGSYNGSDSEAVREETQSAECHGCRDKTEWNWYHFF